MIVKTEVNKGRTVKSKGIALTHVDQGYSANQRPVSLLMKSDIAPDLLTVDVIKALRQVSVEISMEEFLRRFFDMWSSDAQLLAKLMGYETELEAEAEENPSDEWLQQYNANVQERLAEKMESITLLKSAHDGKELSLPEQFTLLKAQQAFEQGAASNGIDFEEATKVGKPVEKSAETASTVSGGISSGNQTVVQTKEETPVTIETVDVTKSQAYIDLMKANEELKARDETAKAIIKANEDLLKSKMIEKAAGMAFVAEDQRESIATMLLKADNALVLTVLEKAQETIATLTQQIVDVKKEFGEKEHGQDGPVSTTDVADPQAILNANIAKAKAEMAAKTNA